MLQIARNEVTKENNFSYIQKALAFNAILCAVTNTLENNIFVSKMYSEQELTLETKISITEFLFIKNNILFLSNSLYLNFINSYLHTINILNYSLFYNFNIGYSTKEQTHPKFIKLNLL